MSLFASFARCLVAALLVSSGTAALAGVVNMPPQSSTFSGFTRGYFFTAQSSFSILGVQVLNQTNSTAAFQNFEILRFNAGAPPAFSGTTNNFTSLVRGFDLDSGVFQPVNVFVNVGDIIGIYGNTATSSGSTSGLNSYGPGSSVVTIDGFSTQLNRSGMQAHLGSATGNMANVWSETGSIGRIAFTTGTPVSEPSALFLAGSSLALLVFARRARRSPSASGTLAR
jgi:hypothetical protein